MNTKNTQILLNDYYFYLLYYFLMKLDFFKIDKTLRKFLLMSISLLLLSGFISFYESINDVEPEVLSSIDDSEIVNNGENVSVNWEENNREWYEVEKVVDGDTVRLKEIGTVRLIGVDTPETVHPTKKVECFGIEASNKMKEIVDGNKVRIELDKTQGEKDRYGRYLVYLFTFDNTFVNLDLIREGYAYEYTYSSNYKYQTEFKAAQTYAKENLLGLWGSKCN